jgi:hypothetical protein
VKTKGWKKKGVRRMPCMFDEQTMLYFVKLVSKNCVKISITLKFYNGSNVLLLKVKINFTKTKTEKQKFVISMTCLLMSD